MCLQVSWKPSLASRTRAWSRGGLASGPWGSQGQDKSCDACVSETWATPGHFLSPRGSYTFNVETFPETSSNPQI